MGGEVAVSVIIPAYNRGDLLPRAIESVRSQTVTDLEVLVVDDGSTDETASIVDRCPDDRVRVLRHNANRGPSAARNTGIRAARGKYVAFLDSDDEWRPHKLERQIGRLAAGPDDAVAAFCETERRRRGLLKPLGERLFPESTSPGETIDFAHPVIAMDVAVHAGSTLLVERDVATSIGFDEGLPAMEDLDFVVRLLDRGRLVSVDERLVVQNETGYPSLETMIDARRAFLTKHAARIDRLESMGYCIRPVHEFYLAKDYLREGRFASAAASLRRAHVPDGRQLSGLGWSLLAGITALARRQA